MCCAGTDLSAADNLGESELVVSSTRLQWHFEIGMNYFREKSAAAERRAVGVAA
jgi:hemolysin activation/secretion protein